MVKDLGATGPRMDRRSVLGLGAAVATGAALSACGSSSGSGGKSAGSKKLTVLLQGPTQQTIGYVNKQVVPAFAKSSGYTVEVQQSDWDFQKIMTAAASGTLADVVMLGGIWTAPLASKNALLELDDRLNSWSGKSQFYSSMIKDCQYNGKTYALPIYSDTRTPIYRKDLLAKAGASTDDLPTSWDSFRTLAQQLAAAKPSGMKSPVDWGLNKSIGVQQTFAQLLFQAGGTYYDASGKAHFNSPQGIKALDYLTSFYTDHLADVNMVDQGTGATAIVAGQAAMTYGALSTYQNAAQYAPDAAKNLVAGKPLSATEGGRPVTSAWINKIGISSHSKDPDGAWKLLQYLAGKRVDEHLDELYGGLPAREDLANAPYMKHVAPNLSDAAKYIVPQPPSPNMLTIAPQIATFLEKAIRNPGNSATILAQLDAKINEINGG